MIFGDPFCFSIQFDHVADWNPPDDGFWKNGMVSIYLGGKRVFDVVDSIELRCAFDFYKAELDFSGVDLGECDLSSREVYENVVGHFFGDGRDLVDGVFYITWNALNDFGFFLCFMKSCGKDRFVWSADEGKTVHEILLPSGSLSRVSEELSKFSGF
ncbi:Imm42 family immunity protein [Corticimicrobacter populi]|uniref:Uncharacterized protein n=1 Tax=Corticimicrobacter populi TaxID=2175229 RepID=A0A2V1K0G6_9BURK|nr:Imm42 family immunity protein [Corticimicrobacter populi]PWF24686.1 hypothetical protein DD235_00345 [Corticimicrobacter populi]